MAMLMLLRRMGMTVTVHGFRSCFRDWVSEETNHSPEVAEKALAHTVANRVEAASRRGSWRRSGSIELGDHLNGAHHGLLHDAVQ